jgi:drug/metabolite transporter (DMT)-like permease
LGISDKNEKGNISLAILIPAVLSQQILSAICFPVAKYGLAFIEPFTYAFFRYLIASTVLLAISFSKHHENRIPRSDLWRIAGLGFLIIPMNQTLYLLGQSFTAAGHASIMFATTPVWVFLMSVFYLKEQLFWRRTLGFIFGTEYLIGDVIIMVSVLAWALYTILGKPLVEKYGALRVTAYAISFGSLMYLPLGVYSASMYDYSKATLLAWVSIIYMAVGMSVIGYVIWYWLLKHMPASRLAVFSNIQPVIATTVAFFALGEQPGVPFFIGASIVLLGVILTEV